MVLTSIFTSAGATQARGGFCSQTTAARASSTNDGEDGPSTIVKIPALGFCRLPNGYRPPTAAGISHEREQASDSYQSINTMEVFQSQVDRTFWGMVFCPRAYDVGFKRFLSASMGVKSP